ncbi:MAG: hypothetical protein ACT4PE_07405 [Candidatus Eiseniibacteriota bacterium]
MGSHPSPELEQRLARLGAVSANGGGRADAAPSTDDLDWFLYESFPECAVPAETFVGLVPLYERALRTGASFDFELLFVRVVELAHRIGKDGVLRVAWAARDRLLDGRFEPQEGIAALRFALRALPEDDPFLDEVLQRESLAAFREEWALDFMLDERGPAEYFALSYLRDDDPETAEVLACFPVPASRAAKLAAFLDAAERRTPPDQSNTSRSR